MGIAIALFYLPILAIMTFIAIRFAKSFRVSAEDGILTTSLRGLAMSLGVLFTAAIVLIAGSYVPRNDPYGFERLFQQMAIALLSPFVIGIVLHLLGRYQRSTSARPVAIAWVNYLAIGSPHAVWVVPVGFIAFLVSACDPHGALHQVFGSYCK